MTVVIENSDILQACYTVLIGVLIFLTLERKFERKDLTTYRLEVERQRNLVSTKVNNLSNQVVEIEKELLAKKDSITPYTMGLKEKRGPLIHERDGLKQDVNNMDNLLHEIDSQGKIDDSITAHYQKIKDREDIMNSIAVALLSTCVIFMIFVPTGWKYDILDYSVVSRILFAAGIGALVIRVFLYTWDVKSTKSSE